MSEQKTPILHGREVSLRLTFDDINLVLAALGRAPFDQVEGTISKIRTQVQASLQAEQQPAEETK